MRIKKLISIAVAVLISTMCICSVQAADTVPVVEINSGGATKYYTKFADGWNKAVKDASTQKDVTFTLLADWKADKNGSFGSGNGFSDGALLCDAVNPITLDLNGFVIDRNLTKTRDDGAVIYVKSKLIVNDSNPKKENISEQIKGGVITGGANDDEGGGIVIEDGATLTMNGGIVANCASDEEGGGILVDGERATLNLNKACLYGNHSYESDGGAICCNDGTVILNGALLEGNYSEDNGGAVFVDDGTFKATDCKFYGNCSENGGAIYFDDGADSNLENCVFKYNKAENGGAYYVDSNDGTYLKNCVAIDNKASKNGGAVFTEGDRVFFIGGEYQLNSAGEHGGGIYTDSMYDVNIAGKLIVKDNTVGKNANDLCLQNGSFTEAYLYCGGLYEGSLIYLCSTDKDSRLAVADIDTYQYKNYIRFDSGFTQDRVEIHSQSQNGIRAEGTALGNGNIVVIIILAVVIVGVIAFMVIYSKRRKGAVEHE